MSATASVDVEERREWMWPIYKKKNGVDAMD